MGIFADEAHTQPAENVEQNIIPIEMNGKAAASVSTEVMTEENGETVVLYLAEVTADGTPVDQVKGFGYDAEIDTPTVVFTVMDDEQSATITNWSKSDDTTVTTETSESTETENENTKNGTQNGVKTGDDTPVEMTWLLFVVSAAMLLILGNRRKRQM